MKAFYTDGFVLPLPPTHSFPMAKYAMLRHAVEAEGLADLEVPLPASDVDLLRAHDLDYVRRVVEGGLTAAEVREIGLPWSPDLVERSRRSVGATIAASRAALQDGVGINLAGGTHHARADKGAGYCVFNDAAVASRVLQAEGLVRRVMIVDCDVHQGDGTAAIFADDLTVFTFSIHSDRNYPLRKRSGDLDVPLPDGADDDAYTTALRSGLADAFSRFVPDLLIYLAGADPHEGDRLGRLKVTADGLRARDRLVFDASDERQLPVGVAMAGGYGRRIEDTVAVHLATVREARRLDRSQGPKVDVALGYW